MKLIQKVLPGLFCLALFFSVDAKDDKKKSAISFKNDDIEVTLTGKIETQTTADIYATLLNKNVPDKLVATKTKIDLSLYTKVDCARSRVTARNKVVWGNHKVIYTDTAFLTTLNAVATGHSHSIGPNMLWLREIWVELDITKACKLADLLAQTLTLGSFSFRLGRGITLGDAYSVNPGLLGFFQDNTVDQFAWGAKLSGGLIKETLNYDIYLSILSDNSTSLKETNAPTQIKAFGGDGQIVRGAGQIGYVLAGRFVFTPLVDSPSLKFEPYAMHHHDPEQKLEFFADAKANLTTGGFAIEYTTERFEIGLDCAQNFGCQYIKGWDRNAIVNVNDGGYSAFVYSEVYNVDPATTTPTAANNVLVDPQNSTQTKAIANTPAAVASNGQPIAGTNLYNSLSRYRAPYKVDFKGFMIVTDLSIWLIPKRLSLNATAGLASGDQNPHQNMDDPNDAHVDGTYEGFIPFQEIYSGLRVPSFYGMASGILRPLTVPKSGGKFATTVNNFTNLVFVGYGFRLAPQDAEKPWSVSPNMIFYWNDASNNSFDITTGLTSDIPASKQLGYEANLFFETHPTNNVYISGGVAVFVPGQHYFDIQGKPTSAIQRALLDAAVAAGKPTNKLPLIGDNTAVSVSMAMGYTF